MGKPATDWFCRNGHHVDGAGCHNYCVFDNLFDEEDWVCPHCGIKGHDNFHLITEWNGHIYSSPVPHTPIRNEDVEQHDHYGNKYFVEVPVYDVSKLFAEVDQQSLKEELK